ncbi:hypothetical protein Goshw_005354 [Gossypium schwendimanii]|uniref:DUF7745 domain-containing protein n=2 Tax=Gossypium schwendimanii TaxID=34291 RepID=A0A7J9M9W2_GOSSC|nr:hypothetical protein [Gossypium schwendimanii]
MEREFLNKVEDNMAVRVWSEKVQQEKGDSLMEGYVKRVDIFALSIYGLVVFPKVLGYVEEAVADLFDRLDKGVTMVPDILAETFRSLNACRRAENYSPLKELVAIPRRDDITREKWMMIFQNLQEENVEWRAPWMIPNEILNQCGEFDWVPLLGIWGATGYAPLLVLR